MSSATGPKPLDAATKERRRQAWQRRMAGVEGLVHKALRGNPDPLIAYIDGGGPLQLSENDRQWLAYLLEQKLPRIGRPPGSLTPKNEAIRCASYLVRI